VNYLLIGCFRMQCRCFVSVVHVSFVSTESHVIVFRKFNIGLCVIAVTKLNFAHPCIPQTMTCAHSSPRIAGAIIVAR
jgi:hypothetical protein